MSGAMSRRKGNAAEVAVVKYLRINGFPHCKRHGAGFPGADIDELGPGLEIEVKNAKELKFPAWVRQLEEAMAYSDADMGAVIAKRFGCADVAEWYFIQPVGLFDRLVDTRDWHQWPGVSPRTYIDLREALRLGTEDAPHIGDLFVIDFRGLKVTTAKVGVRLLRDAGYGDPIEASAA